MGDAADDLADLAIRQQIEFEEEVRYLLGLSDAELKLLTAKARIPIVVSIRQQRNLSPKQRLVLAKWIANQPDEY